MNTRREFLKQAGAVGLCAIGTNAALASPSQTESYRKKDTMIKNTKLLSIKRADGGESLGVVTDDGVIDVHATAKKLGMHLPSTVDDLLRHGATADLAHLVANARHSGVPLLSASAITPGRLFTNPGKIICVGLNYRQHAKEIGMPEPRVPPLFNKFNNALAAHQCVITLPPKDIAIKFDYETELLIIIGRPCRNVSESEALGYVAGYCTANDFSARDLQLELPAGQWMIGKTLDNFAPVGPYFVSADLVGDPNNLKLQTFVNGELRQSSNTSDFIFNAQQMIAYISKHWTLDPGDIIFTGTPQGVIAGKPKEEQVWLKAGDQVVSVIEKLGELRFTLA